MYLSSLRTSSSMFASAISCALPLPLAIFCASAICDRTAYQTIRSFYGQSFSNKPTSALKSSSGKPSTALMLSSEFGWTTANPPETIYHLVRTLFFRPSNADCTEKLFASSALLNNLDETRLQLFDCWNMVC